jgi:hypothetical protein
VRILISAALALLLAGPLFAADQPVTLKIHSETSTVDIAIGGEPFTVYNFGRDLPKPFFSPVRAPGGAVITRPLEDPKDHPHHKGVWLAIDEVNDVKFWAERGKIRNVSIEGTEDLSVGFPCELRVVNHWLGEGDKPIVIETTKIAIYPNRLMTYDITFTAGEQPVTFDDTKEGLFGIRFTDSMREREGGRVVNADGLKGSKECWGKPSAWVDYVGEVDDKTYGAAIMDHPDNFRPSRYHVRDYGLFSISPFGEKSYTNGKEEAAPLKLAPGESFRLRYGLYIHTGDTESADVPAAFQQFVQATK